MVPVMYYSIEAYYRLRDKIHIKDEFYIEYLEMDDSKSLWNGYQSFVGSVSEAYWNNDTLVVAGDNGCFIIEFGKTKYSDEMIEISCKQKLSELLKNKPIKKYTKPQ